MRANTPSDGSEPSNVLCSSCRAQQRRRGRPPCRRQARTRDRAVTACALSHGTIAARGARPRPAAYQPALRVKFAMKVCKRTQQRWSGLLSCALSSKCVLPSVTHCGPTLSRTPTRATSTPSYVPSVALLSDALIGLNVNRLRYPICSVALSFCTSLSTSLICSAPCGHGHLDLRVVHGEHLRISPFLPDAVKVHRPERVAVPMAG